VPSSGPGGEGKAASRTAPHGSANDNDLLQLQNIKQACMGVGLGRGRRIGWQRGSQIAESRRSHYSVTWRQKSPGQIQTLIKAAAGTMDCEDDVPATHVGIFDQSAGRVGDLAPGCDAGSGGTNVIPIAAPDHDGPCQCEQNK